MTRLVAILTAAVSAGNFPTAKAAEDPRLPELPAPLCDGVQVAEGNRVSAHFYASGVQIYQWSGTNWGLVAPAATLYADPGYQAAVGVHFGGPTWQAADGSQVKGTRVDGCSPFRGALPWLRLRATLTVGPGIFDRVTFIQRVNTVGGLPPAEPGAFVGEEARVPYTAEYYFYRESR